MAKKSSEAKNSVTKFIVTYCGADYDCGAPQVEIINGRAYDTKKEAYDTLIEHMKSEFGDELDEDSIPSGPDDFRHKCETAHVLCDDGEFLWDIQEIEVA